MKEIIEKLKENRDIELAKSILESNGYQVINSDEKLNESAIDEFWKLYDRDQETGEDLEDIADKLGIGSDNELTEDEAKRILAVYRGEGRNTLDTDEMIEEIISACSDISGVSSVQSFEEAGLMTKNKGFVIKTTEGQSLQFSLLGSF